MTLLEVRVYLHNLNTWRYVGVGYLSEWDTCQGRQP